MSRNYIGMGRYEQLFDQLDAAISGLETRCDKIERRRTNLLASKATYAQQACYVSNREIRTRPLPDPPPQPGRRYTQPTYRQPQHQKRDRYLSQPPYQPGRHRPHHLHQSHYQLPKYYQPFGGPSPAYSEFPRRQIRQSQHGPGHQPSCWDPPGARVPINSLSFAESTSIYNPNFDCDSDGYDEDFDVGYSRQPYHQQHSVPHLRQAAACLEQPAAQQQPLLQLPPSCRHPSSGTLDEEPCFMDDKIDDLCDNEKGVGLGSITATGTLPAPPHAAESQCFSHLHLHQNPYISSPLAVAAILLPQATISPPCSPDVINIVGQHRGKSSTPKGEIKSVLSNKWIIGRTASGNQPMITGSGCLTDTNMEQEKLTTTDASIGFSYVMAETRDPFAIKYVYIGHEIVGYWGAKQQSRVFDPGGAASPKHIFVKIVIVSWFPP